MGDFSFDPATGQQGTSLPVPGGGRPAWGGPDNPWTPNAFPIDPHCDPYGDEATTGGLPPNVVAGEVDGDPDGIHGVATVDVTDFGASKISSDIPDNIVTRAAGEDWDGGDGFTPEDIDDANDGDTDHHDDPTCDPDSADDDDCDEEDCLDSFVADNIIRGHVGPRRLGASNNVTLPTRGRFVP